MNSQADNNITKFGGDYGRSLSIESVGTIEFVKPSQLNDTSLKIENIYTIKDSEIPIQVKK